MKANAASKGLQFILETEGTVPDKFVTDPLRLKQILNNIIGNAIKFTSDGHVKATVRLDNHRNRLVFTVSDTGIGVPRDVRDKLFQSFSRTQRSSKLFRCRKNLWKVEKFWLLMTLSTIRF